MALYRWLLRFCPPRLRREYGSAMEGTVARRMADARHVGRWRAARVWHREIMGLLVVALSERWSATHPPHLLPEQRPGMALTDRVGQELRFAARRLTRSPGFAVTAAATLALAIGANAALFTVVQRVVVNPLPYPEADRLIELDHGSVRLRVGSGMGNTAGLFFHYLERSR